MSEKEKIGGRAYVNGVRLMNSNFTVKVYYDKNDNLNVEKNTVKESKWINKFKKIPVLRGIVSLLFALIMFLKEGIGSPKKYWFIFLIILLDIIIIFLPYFGNSETTATALNFAIFIYYSLPILLIIIFRNKIGEALRYHGAEHKTVNYYENDCKGRINSYSRLHQRCGSNIVFYYLIISLLLGFLNLNFNSLLWELLYLGIAYELIRYTPDKLIFLPHLFQRLVTREPEEKHIRAAKLALDVLTGQEGN